MDGRRYLTSNLGRRRKAQSVSGNPRSVSQGETEIIVFKERTHVASPNMGRPRKGALHGGALSEDLTMKATKDGEMETKCIKLA